MKLGIDSYPLNRRIHRTYDYTGMQLLSLNHLPLFKVWTQLSSRGEEVKIVTGERKAQNYLNSMERIAKANPLIRKVAWRGIRSVEADRNVLSLKVDEREFDSDNLLYLPNVAIRTKRKECELILVKSPEHNHELFEKGEIDFLCDTAVDLARVDKSYRSSWTGLIGSLDYSASFKKRKGFVALEQMINAYRPAPRLEALNPVQGNGSLPIAVEPCEVVIAYDDFYPNKEIVEDLAQHLKGYGVRTRLIKDDYYTPKASYDIKYVINRPMGDSMDYYWLWLFNFSNAASPEIRAKIFNNIKEKRGFSFSKVSELGLGRVLFKIPSLGKASVEENPLHQLLGDLYELDIQ